MPYKTEYGSHYHETYGCHGATIPCDTAGLTPCSDCCGHGHGSSDGLASAGPSGAGSPVGTGVTGEHQTGDGTDGISPASQPSPSQPVRDSDELVSKGAEGLSDGLSAPESDVDAEGIGRANEGIRQQFGYRSELLFGEGYTEAGPVMAHETFVLDNTDILRHLGDGVLSGTEVGERMLHIADVMDGSVTDGEVEAFLDRCLEDQDECVEGREFFEGLVLPAIKERTGHDIRHVLWLCDCPEDVIGAYGMIEDITEDDIDEHEVGVMTLSEIGGDGKLWGYEHEIERPDLGGWW